MFCHLHIHHSNRTAAYNLNKLITAQVSCIKNYVVRLDAKRHLSLTIVQNFPQYIEVVAKW